MPVADAEYARLADRFIALRNVAWDVVQRWDSPSWKEMAAMQAAIEKLRAALQEGEL